MTDNSTEYIMLRAHELGGAYVHSYTLLKEPNSCMSVLPLFYFDKATTTRYCRGFCFQKDATENTTENTSAYSLRNYFNKVQVEVTYANSLTAAVQPRREFRNET